MNLSQNTYELIGDFLDCSLEEAIEGMDVNPQTVDTFLTSLPTDSLASYLSPQWIVLAAGKGTRIDPTGRFSKTLDIMFGEKNMLQLSRQYLPGNLPHIIVINPQMANHLSQSDSFEYRLGPNSIPCIQDEMNGTGGALQAALPEIQMSDAEWIGISFGDEPFLEKTIFVQTWLSHFMSGADVTLCGKKPDSVVDKGGLFFDTEEKFIGTKEWYDMTDSEKEEMEERLSRGNAYTNTGITIIRKKVLLDRINRLQPHTNRNDELHHVDLIRLCYEDGLKTNAFIYQGDVMSGVNRWSNVISGEAAMYARTRDILVQKGIRVDPSAQITLENDNIEIGQASYLIGRIHIGSDVRIGDYCRFENVSLIGATNIGDSVGLKNVRAKDTTIQSNDLPTKLAEPIVGLSTASNIHDSTFDGVTIGVGVELSDVNAHVTVIPSNIRLKNKTLGVPLTKAPYGVPAQLFNQIIPEDYRPGVYTFGEMKALPDWNNLRNHVSTHSASELIPRATLHAHIQQDISSAVNSLLDMKRANGEYLIEPLTAEELWGTIFEMVHLYSGNTNPYFGDKLKARQTALSLLPEFWNEEWLTKLKLVVSGNVIDYSSARVVEKVNANPNYFSQALRAAVETPFAIDCYDLFMEKVIDGNSKQIMFLIDNDGEVIFDMALIQDLIECGHRISIVGKADNASNDVTLADLKEITAYPQFAGVNQGIQDGVVRHLSSGAKTIGTNLYNATPEFINELLHTDLVVSKGQGNFFTTPGWKMDTFYLLLSKGLTAERTTGVVADRNLPVDGLILAYLPAGTNRDKLLSELCKS